MDEIIESTDAQKITNRIFEDIEEEYGNRVYDIDRFISDNSTESLRQILNPYNDGWNFYAGMEHNLVDGGRDQGLVYISETGMEDVDSYLSEPVFSGFHSHNRRRGYWRAKEELQERGLEGRRIAMEETPYTEEFYRNRRLLHGIGAGSLGVLTLERLLSSSPDTALLPAIALITGLTYHFGERYRRGVMDNGYQAGAEYMFQKEAGNQLREYMRDRNTMITVLEDRGLKELYSNTKVEEDIEAFGDEIEEAEFWLEKELEEARDC